MSRNGRIAVIIGAVLIATVGFIVLRPSDDDNSDGSGSQAQGTVPASGDTTGAASPPPKPEPRVDRIRVRAGEPVGGVKNLTWEKGDNIRVAVASDEAHEVHIHGYDLSKDVAAGGTARFKIDANLDGIYEIELEDLAEPIAELKVEP